MTRLSLSLGAVALAATTLLAQSAAPAAQFEIAGIQPSTRPQPGMRGGILRGNRYELRNATMVDLVRTAYNVAPEKITGGPSWLEWNRWDVAALAPEGTPPAKLQEMLRNLLAERFKLTVREDMVTTTNLALKVSGTHKLRPAAAGGPGGCQGSGSTDANGIQMQTGTCRNETMAQFVDLLPRAMGAYFPNGIQLVDETGLEGAFDFEFTVHPRQLLAQAGADAISLDKALAGIGLKLEPKEMKVPAIVVQSVTAEYTPNPPDLARRMPPPPEPTFEVIDVKPSPPGNTNGRRMQLQPNGQVNGNNAPLNLIITLAWSLPGPDFLVGPSWLPTNGYEVIGRVYATTNPNAQVQQDEDIARRMLQNLVIDRFKMKYHMEDRPMTAYVIKADTIKMAKADPTRRTRCFEGLPPGTPAPRGPQLPRQVTCQNITMAQFGTWLPTIAGGYTRLPARDLTGSAEAYDFSLGFSPIEQVQGPRPEAGAVPAGGAALDPTGAVSLLDAVRSQLGIRLEEEKRPVPVMVIDTISEKPTDN